MGAETQRLAFRRRTKSYANLKTAVGSKKESLPIAAIAKADVLFLDEQAQTGRFRPVLDWQYPLEKAEAYRDLETGQEIGNFIIALAQWFPALDRQGNHRFRKRIGKGPGQWPHAKGVVLQREALLGGAAGLSSR